VPWSLFRNAGAGEFSEWRNSASRNELGEACLALHAVFTALLCQDKEITLFLKDLCDR
jgi:hypothetical protein